MTRQRSCAEASVNQTKQIAIASVHERDNDRHIFILPDLRRDNSTAAARAASGHAADQRDELTPFQLIELHSIPPG